MSGGFAFDREMGERMVAIYQTRDAVRRRRLVRDALQLQPGEQVIDIGTGPGFVAVEMADGVGSGGRILAIDNSEAMLQLARGRCAGRPWVALQSGSATSLPAADASFDVAVSVQVFEYVADVDIALAEAFRVLRPGGRALVVATDWDSVLWHSEDPQRMHRVLHAFGEHSAFSNLPRTLAARMRRAGFTEPQAMAMTQFNPRLDPDTFSFHMMRSIADFVPGRRGVTAAEATAWRDELQALGARGQYFFSLHQFAFLASRPT